jgi:hypothetical protein
MGVHVEARIIAEEWESEEVDDVFKIEVDHVLLNLTIEQPELNQTGIVVRLILAINKHIRHGLAKI